MSASLAESLENDSIGTVLQANTAQGPPKRSTLCLAQNVYGRADGWQTVLSCLNLERSGMGFSINR